jgi:hypothetical protein
MDAKTNIRPMKLVIFFCLACLGGMAAIVPAQAQSLIGKWQLVKQTSCLDDDDDLNVDDLGMQEVVDDMKSRAGASAQILQLKDNNSGEENTRIISRKKTYNSRSFLYKYDGTALHFLDKKSRTIIESFTVEKLEGDSLIISNASRACETKVFVRIKP